MSIELKVNQSPQTHNPSSRAGEPNTIEFRTKPAAKGLGMHYFAVYIDKNRKEHWLAGYSERQDMTNFGNLIAKNEDYKPNTADYTSYKVQGTISGSPKEIKELFGRMQSSAQELERRKLPYHMTERNSNSFIFTAGQMALDCTNISPRINLRSSLPWANGTDVDISRCYRVKNNDSKEKAVIKAAGNKDTDTNSKPAKIAASNTLDSSSEGSNTFTIASSREVTEATTSNMNKSATNQAPTTISSNEAGKTTEKQPVAATSAERLAALVSQLKNGKPIQSNNSGAVDRLASRLKNSQGLGTSTTDQSTNTPQTTVDKQQKVERKGISRSR
jgi:hypothetical protein